MKCDYNSDQLASLVEKQISIYWNFEVGGIKCAIPKALKRLERNLNKSNSGYCWKDN